MNKKTKFFKNVLLLQFIPVLLIGILILSNFREQKTLRIRQLHPYEFNYGYAIPLFVFGIGLVLALFSLFSKQEDVLVDESEILKIKRRQNFWKFAFYCNIFLLVVSAVFSVMISLGNSIVIDDPVMFYSLIFSRSLLVLIVSLVVASFLLAVGINWKTNKALAVTILIFGFFIIGVSIFGDFLFVRKFNDASESYKMAKNEKKIPAKEEEQLGDYDGDDSYEESEESDDATLLYQSWISLIKEWGGTEGKDDLFAVRKSIEYSQKGYDKENDHYLLQFIDRLRNNPDELYSEFEMYKPVLYSTVSGETYRVAKFDKIVNGLLLAYEDIGSQRDKLIEIYRVMGVDHDYKSSQDKYFYEFESYFSPETVQKIRDLESSGSYTYYIESDLMWFYGFWVRRHNEGNIKKVAIILKEIKEHYDQNSEE
ncbi:hypothetical protein C8C83_2268 [Flavobacterium sp. 90]|uniref:hypothetical protein n=1 Tax=unclassified Flavobacterium TaxID=196869 RepID=UPI000EACE807|nr:MULTISPECIES: hypothetical protein [unclassified Flavobacterium]RKR10592.1 hypothetical protein C8C82_2573 [Flavobacterium sp. 81]TCK54375.1 hypothetical protein C8C83_2268 [Flavobacterium sp. 90]